MADATTLFAVDNLADYPVIVQTPCARVVVQENYNSATPPTADLLQKMPATAANAANIAKGTPAIYAPQSRRTSFGQIGFNPGDIAGSIRTAAGSITVQQIESLEV